MTITLTIGGVHKGGVGKTTAAITVGHGLALAGYDTLIVDLDGQGHVSYYLGMERRPGLFNLLINGAKVKDCVKVARAPHLCILPSDLSTADVEEQLTSMRFREQKLAAALAPLQKRGPDFIILDTAPGAGPLHDAAMAASDYVLAVVEASTASLDGLGLLTGTIAEFQGAGYPVGLLGVLPTMIDDRTIASREAMAALQGIEDRVGRVYPAIHRATVFQQAVSEGKTLWEMDPASKTRAASEYGAVIQLLLEDLAK